MQYSDIITGDRIISLCDFVIITEPILSFHKNLTSFISPQNIILIKDFKKIDANAINALKRYFENFADQNKTKLIKLFIYTHILEEFIDYILDILDKRYEYIIYLHNSDNQFTDKHKSLLNAKHIIKVFAQNINFSESNTKLAFLPIGLANSMWSHGNISALSKTINRISLLKKTKNLYVNINPDTFFYRKNVLDAIKESENYNIVSIPKSFEEYLDDLAEHRFCLCVRGNGIDTHRFWESLYLGVIPVIINNKNTNMEHYVKYLKRIDIPFFEITEDSLEIVTQRYIDNFFNEDLYNKLLKKLDKSIDNLEALKLSYYSNE